jgi:predicted CXXCH cytochrome family protein
MIRLATYFSVCLALAILFLGGTPPADMILLSPSASDSVSSETGRLLLVSVPKSLGTDLVVSSQWWKERMFPLDSKAAREGFVKDFYRLVDAGTTLEQVTWTFRYFAGYVKPETLIYNHADTVTLRSFWSKKAFTDLVKTVQLGNASEIIVSLRGWKDSVVTTSFDDPNNDARSLFKLQLRLISGPNAVFLTLPTRPDEPLVYRVRSIRDAMPMDTREKRFHGTGLEAGCVACHDGLTPSAAGMTADCSSCHASLVAGNFLHAPVEMKECGTCHTLSAGQSLMNVEKGTPGACVECHVEKQTLLDSAAVQHPVASDCTGCHNPHSSDQQHLLKLDVYRLCTECHEDHKINHPVGKHPLRFVTIEGTEKEISCVSCHDPHGSPNQALLKVGGGSMEICMECHQK